MVIEEGGVNSGWQMKTLRRMRDLKQEFSGYTKGSSKGWVLDVSIAQPGVLELELRKRVEVHFKFNKFDKK